MIKTTAAVLYETGLPRPYAESLPLVVDEINLEPPGKREVLVEVSAAGLCHSDLSVIDGSRPRVRPMVLGHEASGIVREIGAEVKDFEAGDHVVFSFVPICGQCDYCVAGRAALCTKGARTNMEGSLLSGNRRFADAKLQVLHHHLGVSAFSRFTVTSQESLVKIDQSLPLETAALFGCAVMTGVGAVFNTAQVSPGKSVAIFGLGGVGLSAVMGASASGAYPIVVADMFEEKLALGRELGATHAVNVNQTDAAEAIREITKGGAEYVFECAGSEQVLIQAYESTKRGGTTIALGLPHPNKMFSVPAVTIVAEEKVIRGSYMGSSVPRRDIPRYVSLYQAGLLPVDQLRAQTLKLEEINEGFDRLATGETVRQIIRF
jgi:alcohol dehydrogenase